MAEEKKDVTGGANLAGDKGENQGGQAEVLTFSKEEYEKKLQSEADKRVNQALSSAKQTWEKEVHEKILEERKEAERLAKLSEDDRKKELEDKQKNELSIREKTIARKEMKLEAINILSEKKLPIKFADMLIGETAEETQSRIKNFEKAYKDEIDAEVTVRLKGTTPKGGTDEQKKKGLSMNDIIRGKAGSRR